MRVFLDASQLRPTLTPTLSREERERGATLLPLSRE
jgi:hypothetical protein